MIVVDTNVVSYLHIPNVRRPEATAILSKEPIWAVPYLWRSEFRNVLIGCVRRHEFDIADAVTIEEEARSQLRDSEYHVDSRDVLELAHTSGCTAYDCEFVALARELGVPLVTMDKQLLKAFPKIAVSLK